MHRATPSTKSGWQNWVKWCNSSSSRAAPRACNWERPGACWRFWAATPAVLSCSTNTTATIFRRRHLLYFVIKNHPFSDGNKRIGAFLFVWFLERNKHRFKTSGELKINDNALTVIALLVAQSNPDDKELMVKLICNLISG